MKLSRNAKRRLALYGSAVIVAFVVLSVPRIVRRRVPPVPMRMFQIERDLANEATQLLIEYLRIDTSNPPGHLQEAARFWARAFACEGIPYEVVGADADHPVVVARLLGPRRGDGLMLLHHMDVVPPGDLSLWDKPPFAGEQGQASGRQMGQGFIYGRGTLDMKGQGVANFFAMAALKRAGITPLRDVVFVGEPAEETHRPDLGVGWLRKNRPDLVEGVTDVYNEGGVNEVLTQFVERYGIEVMQKAVLFVDLYAPTKEPLDDFQQFLKAKDVEQRYLLVEPVREFMKFLAPSRYDLLGRLMADPEKAFVSEEYRRDAPDTYRSLIKDTLYPGKPFLTPESGWQMQVVWTLLPGRSVSDAFAEMASWARARGLKCYSRLMTEDSTWTPQIGKAWEALHDTLTLDPIEHAPAGVYVLTLQFSHSSYLRSVGYRTYGMSPFNVNIADAGKIHSPNERIHISLFVEGVERMKRILMEFATSP